MSFGEGTATKNFLSGEFVLESPTSPYNRGTSGQLVSVVTKINSSSCLFPHACPTLEHQFLPARTTECHEFSEGGMVTEIIVSGEEGGKLSRDEEVDVFIARLGFTVSDNEGNGVKLSPIS